MRVLFEALFFAAAIAVNIYPFVYMFRPWWTTAAGRALMTKAWANLILVDLALATMILGEDYPGRQVIRFIGIVLFTIGVWYLLIVLLRTPRVYEQRDEASDRP